MKKKILSLILVMVLIMSGCGSSAEDPVATEKPEKTEENSDGSSELSMTDGVGDLTPFEWYASSSASGHCGTPSASGTSSGSMEIPGWNTDNDNSSGTIAIMDSGIDVTHPDLKDSLYTFSEEQQEKYGCGPHGINMEPAPAGSDPKEYARDITDHSTHGTHVAGILAAGVNGFGISGIAKGVKVFVVRVFADDGEGQDPTDIIRGLEWLAKVAKDVNLKAVNISIGSKHSQLAHTTAVNKLGELGVNVVYASGNETHDLDETVDMGAQNVSPYAINVDAEDMTGSVAPFSNYGKMTTDVCAPGSQILSTIPSITETKSSDGSFEGYADQTRVFLQNTDASHIANGHIETFASETPDVRMYDICPVKKDGTENKKANEIGKQAKGQGLGFTDDTSWEVQVKSLSEKNDKYLSLARENSFGHNLWMAVPVEDEKEIAWLSYTASVNDESNIYSGVASLLCTRKTSSGKEVPAEMDMSIDYWLAREGSNSTDVPRGISGVTATELNGSMWSPCCLNIDSFIKQIQHVHDKKTTDTQAFSELEDPGEIIGPYIWEKDGKKYLLCRYGTASTDGKAGFTDRTCFYLDDIAVTDSQAPTGSYAYMSGSSMAAPMVTATLGIIARDEPENNSLSDDELKKLALERAGKLMGAVEYDDSLLEKCSTGGRINLNNKHEFEKKAPLFTSATETNGTLSLNGFFFGESGSLRIDGAEVAATRWTDQAITADVSAYEPGSHVAMVINSDNKRRQIIFSLKGNIIFENELSLPIDQQGFYDDYTDMMSGNMVVSDQYIFTLGTGGTKLMKALWRYDSNTDTWSRCADLPDAVRDYMAENGCMTVLNEKLYLYSCQKKNDYGKRILYIYDIKRDSWKKSPVKKIPDMGQLFRIENRVFFINPESVRILNTKNGKLSKIKIKMPDIEEINEAKIAVSKNNVYLYGYLEDENYDPIPCMYRLTWDKNKNSFTVENLKKAAKKLAADTEEIAMTGYEDGIFVVGSREESDNRYNTYFIKNNKKQANLYERSACYHKMYMPMAAYAKGVLYVMGINCTEPATLFFRSTSATATGIPYRKL